MIADLVTGLFSDNFSIGGYVFDAYLRMTQTNSLTVTSHPVMTGANVSDHAYINPVEFEFTIGVSDTTLGKVIGQFGYSLLGFGESRSVNAYKKLVEMQEKREPVELHSKYKDCKVVIDSLTPVDDNTTNSALKVRVHMKEILISETTSYKTAESRTFTDSTKRGQQVSQKTELKSIAYVQGGL